MPLNIANRPNQLKHKAINPQKALPYIIHFVLCPVWAKQPINTFLGFWKTTLKSEKDRVNPIPNIIIPNNGLITFILIPDNTTGNRSDSSAAPKTKKAIHLDIKLQILSITPSSPDHK